MSSRRKPRLTFSLEQRLDYAKLMVNENYTVKQVMEISGAGQTAVSRWKSQYLEEQAGKTPINKKALTAEHQEIQQLKKQLWRAKRDNEILKKAAAIFVRED